MILELQKSIEVEVIQGKILPIIPEWTIKTDNIIVGSYENMEQQRQLYSQTVGSGDWSTRIGSEFRFDKDNLLLRSVWVKTSEENLESNEMIEGWVNIEPVIGILRLLSSQEFDCEINEYRWMSSDGKLLVGIDDLDLTESDDKFRLRVAKDFDLLFAEQKWCGWMLSNPARYLAEPNTLADSDPQLNSIAYEYISLISEDNIDFLYDKEPEFLQRILNLKNKIDLNQGAISHRKVFYNALNEIVEDFYY